VRAGSRWPFTHLVASRPDHWRQGDYLPYPFFMGYAATYLQRNSDSDVTFRDSIALRESYKSYYKYLSNSRYDFIFLETAAPSWEHDATVIRRIRELQPHSKIVITGPICAASAEQILNDYPVHACIRGEYEKGSVRVLNGESGIIDYDFLTREEMNSAPFPYYDKVHATRYWDGLPVGQKFPHAHVWTSRGCPFKCVFCVWPATMTGNDPDGTGTRTVRQYTADYVEAFVRELLDRYGFESIYLDDDTFNLGDNHVKSICRVMDSIGIPWSAMCRTDTIKLETWRVMKESGCFGVKLGFESGNQWVLDKIVRKSLDLEQAREVVAEIKGLGMTVHGTFTYGLPGETEEQMMDTKRYAKSLGCDSIQESGCAVIEGTPLHTLASGMTLDKYEGATISDDYVAEFDGNLKLESMFGTKRSPGVRTDKGEE
jgi:radical SAM superfamily enzyme YgiQ (UPF0313 family)